VKVSSQQIIKDLMEDMLRIAKMQKSHPSGGNQDAVRMSLWIEPLLKQMEKGKKGTAV